MGSWAPLGPLDLLGPGQGQESCAALLRRAAHASYTTSRVRHAAVPAAAKIAAAEAFAAFAAAAAAADFSDGNLGPNLTSAESGPSRHWLGPSRLRADSDSDSDADAECVKSQGATFVEDAAPCTMKNK